MCSSFSVPKTMASSEMGGSVLANFVPTSASALVSVSGSTGSSAFTSISVSASSDLLASTSCCAVSRWSVVEGVSSSTSLTSLLPSSAISLLVSLFTSLSASSSVGSSIIGEISSLMMKSCSVSVGMLFSTSCASAACSLNPPSNAASAEGASTLFSATFYVGVTLFSSTVSRLFPEFLEGIISISSPSSSTESKMYS